MKTKTLLTGGSVVSMDPAVGDLVRGDVLIEDGVIVEVAAHIDAPDAEVIDATDRIVMHRAAGPIDLLVCATAVHHGHTVLHVDNDFVTVAGVLKEVQQRDVRA
jgi:predicted amidohydrolase